MLFGIKAEFLQAWLFLILTMSCFRTRSLFAPLLHASFISSWSWNQHSSGLKHLLFPADGVFPPTVPTEPTVPWFLHLQFPAFVFCYSLSRQAASCSSKVIQVPTWWSAAESSFLPVPEMFIILKKWGSSFLLSHGWCSGSDFWQHLVTPFFISPVKGH